MKIFDSFIKRAPNKMFLSILLGALSGVSYALLIPLVMASFPKDYSLPTVDTQQTLVLGFEVSNYYFAKLFLLTCVFILVTKTASQVLLTRLALDVTTALRIDMYEKIYRASIRTLEDVGSSKLIASLTTDIPRIVNGASVLPALLVSAVTLVGMLSFLLYLNAQVFLFVLKCIAVGVITYQLPMMLANRYFVRAREHIDSLQEGIRGLIYGSKELKLNESKKDVYFEQVLKNAEKHVLKDGKTGHTLLRIAGNYGDLVGFFVIGAVSFVYVNYHSISQQELIGVVMALLYITGPVGNILALFPDLAVAKVSQKKVQQIISELPSEPVQREKQDLGKWQGMTFKEVHYRYSDKPGGFAVGPLNFTLLPGQLTFIIGSNGSGKSTISKLITQHYMTDEGDILFGDIRVTPKNIASVRQYIGAIYSDYYLFDRLLSESTAETRKKVEHYLKELDLHKKVTFENNRFSTLALSDGQKRRLALLVAYLDDKDLYLFDEWAADQDPMFKSIFYNEILADLKSMGKTIVVISHDERFFQLADQMLVMEEGRLSNVTQPEKVDFVEEYFSRNKRHKDSGDTKNKAIT